jgi:GNAT superfamily N-acetyltransferase
VAQKVQVLLVDDLDGSEATETVSFGLDGVGYEIDLSSGNAGQLRTELVQFVDHARKSGGAQVRRRRQRNGAGREQSARIREWARTHGHKVNERGRIPANIVAEYEAAHYAGQRPTHPGGCPPPPVPPGRVRSRRTQGVRWWRTWNYAAN